MKTLGEPKIELEGEFATGKPHCRSITVAEKIEDLYRPNYSNYPSHQCTGKLQNRLLFTLGKSATQCLLFKTFVGSWCFRRGLLQPS